MNTIIELCDKCNFKCLECEIEESNCLSCADQNRDINTNC